MGEEALYKVNIKLQTLIFLPLVTVVSAIMGGCMLHSALKQAPVDMVTLGFGLLFCGSAFVLFTYFMVRLFNYHIYADRVEVFWVFGNYMYTVPVSSIQSWREEHVGKQNSRPALLTAYGDPVSIRIPGTEPNYEAIKALLTTGKPRVEPPVQTGLSMSAVLVGYPLMFIGALLIVFAAFTFSYLTQPILPSQLTTFTTTITNQPRFGLYRRRMWLELKTEKYPDFTFTVPDEAIIDSTGWFIDRLRDRDSVIIYIPTDEYEKKITQTKTPGLLDMSMNYHDLKVLGLTLRGKNYVSLDAYNDTIFKGVLMLVPIFSFMFSLLALLPGFVIIRRGLPNR